MEASEQASRDYLEQVLEEMEDGGKGTPILNIVFHSLGWERQVTPRNSVRRGPGRRGGSGGGGARRRGSLGGGAWDRSHAGRG